MRQKFFTVFFLAGLGQFLTCCSSSSNEGETSPAPPSTLRAIMSNISALGSELYNVNWVGKPCVVVNKATTCPAGGDVLITGSFSCPTTTSGDQNTNLDFTYDLSSCKKVHGGLTTTMTGKMTHTGSFSAGGFQSIAYKSVGELNIVAEGSPYDPLDKACAFSLSVQTASGSDTTTVSGVICETPF